MMEVLDPTREAAGAEPIYAERPTSLKGKRVALIENTKYNSDNILKRVGEILMRAPCVMKGYWKREEGNAEAFDAEIFQRHVAIMRAHPDAAIRFVAGDEGPGRQRAAPRPFERGDTAREQQLAARFVLLRGANRGNRNSDARRQDSDFLQHSGGLSSLGPTAGIARINRSHGYQTHVPTIFFPSA